MNPLMIERTIHAKWGDGQWQFLADSGNHLAGQTVPMVPLPDLLCETKREAF